jgi:hypothetical protein
MDEAAINYDSEAKEDDGSCEYDSNDGTTGGGTELPETYIVFDSDSFYMSSNSVNPDQNAYRHQLNFSSKEQLDQTGNDGNTVSTMGLVITFKEKPTTSGTAYFSKSRFQTAVNDSVNFYMSMFVNTGNEYEGENFLSPSSGSIDYTIENGKFKAAIPTMDLILESDQTQKVELSAGELSIDW